MSMQDLLLSLGQEAESVGAIEDGSILGTFVADVTSDSPSEGLGDVLGWAGAAGLAAVAGGALFATTGLGDMLSGRIDPKDPVAEARAGLLLRLDLQLRATNGPIPFAEKRRMLDALPSDTSPGDLAFFNCHASAPLDAEALAQDAGTAHAPVLHQALDRLPAPQSPARQAYIAQLRAALNALPHTCPPSSP